MRYQFWDIVRFVLVAGLLMVYTGYTYEPAAAVSVPDVRPLEPIQDHPAVVERAIEAVDDTYVFTDADLQNPELPTGCEATALAALLHWHGVDVDKVDVAKAMPEGTADDFVNAYWGDPFTADGMACMAPCVVETARLFLPQDETVVDVTGTPLVQLPAPVQVWVTMGIKEPMVSGYSQDGYQLMWNTHCVVLLATSEGTATVWDPLEGMVVYPFSTFNEVYNACGRQAVYIADRGYEIAEV